MKKVSLLFSLTLILSVARANLPQTNFAIQVIDRSAGCFHHEDASRDFFFDGAEYRSNKQRVSVGDVDNIKQMIIHSSTNKQDVLTFLGITEDWFKQNHERLALDSLKPWWKLKYPTFESLPPAARNSLEFESVTRLILDELAEGDSLPSTTSVGFSVSFPGEPSLRISSSAERAGMLPLHVTYGEKIWKTYDPKISIALRSFASINGPNFIHLYRIEKLAEDGWKPSQHNQALSDKLDEILCETTYSAMTGYESAKKNMRITHYHSGHINSEPLSMHLTIDILGKSHIDRAWCWVHLTPEGNTKDSWEDIMSLVDATDEALIPHPWLLEWRNRSPKRHLELQISGGKPLLCSKIFVNTAVKNILTIQQPEQLIYLRKGNGVTGKVYLTPKNDSVVLYDWRKSEAEPWLDAADFPIGSDKYAVISPMGKILSN